MAQSDEQTNVRIPADLKAQLKEEALANNRSLGAEIVTRLQSTFKGKRTPAAPRNLAKHDGETG